MQAPVFIFYRFIGGDKSTDVTDNPARSSTSREHGVAVLVLVFTVVFIRKQLYINTRGEIIIVFGLCIKSTPTLPKCAEKKGVKRGSLRIE